MRTAYLIPFAALAVAACEATPPNVTTADITAFEKDVDSARALPATSIADLPAGTVTYTGQFGSDATVETATDYSMIGDMEMRVFFSSQEVDGRLDNINLIRDGVPEQLMGGHLVIDGAAVNGTILADAEGTLYRVDANKTDYTFADLQMIGSVQTGLTPGDVVSGSVTGHGEGSFDFVLDGDGGFYGIAEQ